MVETDVNRLIEIINLQSHVEDSIDHYFRPSDFLVSPLNNPEKFLNGSYFLTSHQEEISKIIIESEENFHLIKGEPGTGKTLLGYSIIKELCKEKYGIIYFSGSIPNGLKQITEKGNIDVVNGRELSSTLNKNPEFILVDEAHRCLDLDGIIRFANNSKIKVIFLADPQQWIRDRDMTRSRVKKIEEVTQNSTHKLTNKIRTNEKINYIIDYILENKEIREKDGLKDNIVLLHADNSTNCQEHLEYSYKTSSRQA